MGDEGEIPKGILKRFSNLDFEDVPSGRPQPKPRPEKPPAPVVEPAPAPAMPAQRPHPPSVPTTLVHDPGRPGSPDYQMRIRRQLGGRRRGSVRVEEVAWDPPRERVGPPPDLAERREPDDQRWIGSWEETAIGPGSELPPPPKWVPTRPRGPRPPVTVDRDAASKLRLMAFRSGVPGSALRILTSEHGGLWEADFAFEWEPDEEDTVIETEGIRIFLDPVALRQLRGAHITEEDLPGTEAFRIGFPRK